MSKHTKGPFTVRQLPKWSFDIVTVNERDEIVFRRDLPCHTTQDKTPEEALDCVHFPKEQREKCREMNHRALADEVLRASAPALLEALKNAKREIYLLAENATDRIRSLGGDCDPFEATAEITIKRAGIDEALSQAQPEEAAGES